MKKIFFIYVFSIVFTNICISQSFLDDDLNYWDFPLNGLGNFDNCCYAWVVSDSFETDWYTTFFNDQNWSTPIEDTLTNYPPLVWTTDPFNNPSNSEIYIRGHIGSWVQMGPIEKVKIMIMSNDDYQIYLNGNLIGEDLSGWAGPVGVFDVTNVWNNGGNIIAIKGINTLGSGWGQCLVRIYLGHTTKVINSSSNSSSFNLSQNYPNPFNPITKIEYSVKQISKVNINIYNINGELIKELLSEEKNAGSYIIVWDGRDNKGILVASGTYFYQIKVDDFVQAKKMVLLK